jgi:hypothetical protein
VRDRRSFLKIAVFGKAGGRLELFPLSDDKEAPVVAL